MAQPDVFSPSVPVAARINGMFPGRTVVVHGRVEPSCKQFVMQLATGPDNDDDFAFHFCHVIGEDFLRRNCKIDGKWEKAETETDVVPFQPGKKFKLRFVCKEAVYKVFFKSKFLCEYSHREAYHKVTHLLIKGGVSIRNITFGGHQQLLGPAIVIKSPGDWKRYDIPFFNIKNHSVRIIGQTGADTQRFDLNFITASDDVTFHLSARFNEVAVVRNTRIDGAWGQEERDLPEGFPFSQDRPFVIEVSVDAKGYHVAVNGVHQFVFNHRIRPINLAKEFEVGKMPFKEIAFF